MVGTSLQISFDLTSNVTLYLASFSYKTDDKSVKQNVVQMRIIHLLTTMIPILYA